MAGVVRLGRRIVDRDDGAFDRRADLYHHDEPSPGPIKARRGRPKPIVGCPWSKSAKTRRLRELRRLIHTPPCGERVFYEDEVDIDLNPKIGLQWMASGQQKQVLTPGKNEKRYLAGALDVRTGIVTWVEGIRKTSYRSRLARPPASGLSQGCCLHLICDNYRIHKSDIVHAALSGYLAGKIKLHFLPPYCPDHNKIERVWEDLHADVTRTIANRT